MISKNLPELNKEKFEYEVSKEDIIKSLPKDLTVATVEAVDDWCRDFCTAMIPRYDEALKRDGYYKGGAKEDEEIPVFTTPLLGDAFFVIGTPGDGTFYFRTVNFAVTL